MFWARNDDDNSTLDYPKEKRKKNLEIYFYVQFSEKI